MQYIDRQNIRWMKQIVDAGLFDTEEIAGESMPESEFFQLEPYDDRDKESLKTLSLSCMIATARKPQAEATDILHGFLNAPVITRRTYYREKTLAYLKKRLNPYNNRTLRDHIGSGLYLSCFISFPLAMGFCMLIGMLPAFIGGSILYSMLVCAAIGVVVAYYAAQSKIVVQAKAEYDAYYEERVLKEEEYQTAYTYRKKTADMLAEQLKELISEGGLPEEYWPYGKEIWQFIRSGRADTLKEAIPLVEKVIFENQWASENAKIRAVHYNQE